MKMLSDPFGLIVNFTWDKKMITCDSSTFENIKLFDNNAILICTGTGKGKNL